jgi:hypothetical protein
MMRNSMTPLPPHPDNLHLHLSYPLLALVHHLLNQKHHNNQPNQLPLLLKLNLLLNRAHHHQNLNILLLLYRLTHSRRHHASTGPLQAPKDPSTAHNLYGLLGHSLEDTHFRKTSTSSPPRLKGLSYNLLLVLPGLLLRRGLLHSGLNAHHLPETRNRQHGIRTTLENRPG